jgi:hypothetical protein
MARSAKFATGQYAWGMCDICGIRDKLLTLKGTTIRGKATGLLACETCWDPDHPQNFLDRYVTNDPQALQRARPDTGLQQSRELYPPGNWINGQPPTVEQQAVMELEKDVEVGR